MDEAQSVSTSPDYLHAWEKIDAADFRDLEVSLSSKRSGGAAWSQAKAQVGMLWYRRFLKLAAKYPGTRLVPNALIDEVWHAHILDTRKYASDSLGMLGYFLHHAPTYAGPSAVNTTDLFQRTDSLYVQEFGESCTSARAVGIADISSAECESTCDAGD